MITKSRFALCFIILHWAFTFSADAQGTAFTYQGRLSDNAGSVNGSYDFSFQLFDTAAAGTSQSAQFVTNGISVSDGFFTVTLDFGNSPFDAGAARWLEISVRPNGGGAFGLISPRLQLTPTPYAIMAGTISGPVASASLSGTYSNALTLNNAANNLSGAFTGNGANVTNVNAATLNGLNGGSFWKTNGNAGANPTNGAFLGTTDYLPLEIKVNGERAFRIEPSTNIASVLSSPNVIGGYSGNVVSNGVVGAFIGGGGYSLSPNLVAGHFAAVLGGIGNIASGFTATAIGQANTVNGDLSTALGGGNVVSGVASTALGGDNTVSGDSSTALGSGNNVSGDNAIAIGRSTAASAVDCIALGFGTTASGEDSTAMGRDTVAGGTGSMAAGTMAKALHEGSFVWADHLYVEFASTASNQFRVRATGGAQFVTAGAGMTVDSVPVFTGLNAGSLTNLNAAQLTGTVPTSHLPSNLVTNGQTGVSLSGTFSGNGANVTSVNAATLNGLTSAGFWKTNGNAGANPTNGAFLGTADNLPLEIKVNGQRAFRIEPDDTSPNVIGGYSGNAVSNGVVGGFIGGGGSSSSPNRVGANFASVMGGINSTASGFSSTASGFGNKASGSSSIAIGTGNTASGDFSTALGNVGTASGVASVAMGNSSLASGDYSTAIGAANTASGFASTAMGSSSLASGDYATAVGRNARATHDGTFVWADDSSITPFTSTSSNQFLIRASGGVGIGTANPASALQVNGTVTAVAFVGSGSGLSGLNAATLNGLTSAGFWKTNGNAGASGAFLGTTDNQPLDFKVNSNRALRLEYAFDSNLGVVAPNVIGGFAGNLANSGVSGAFIGGGGYSSKPNVVGGNYAAVVGGFGNTANGDASTAMGELNIATGVASLASGLSCLASGDYSAAIGGFNTASGDYSTAMGYAAHATNDGTFVWSDASSGVPFTSTANNQFLLRASGGVGIGTTSPTLKLTIGGAGNYTNIAAPAIMLDNTAANGRRWEWHSLDDGRMQFVDFDAAASRLLIDTNGNVGIGVTVPTNKLHVAGGVSATAFVTTSDRNAKENFSQISPVEVLAKVASLPITKWNFKEMKDGAHLGPMAQDFYAAFGLGGGETTITTVDADGVALAAIQGLNQKLEEKDSRIRELEKRLDKLEKLLNRNSNDCHK